MNLEQFQSRLRKIGADIPQGTLKRWAYDGLISRPERYKKGQGGGKGRAASWNRAAIADAAALWAVRNAGGHKLLQSKKRIDVIKHAVASIFRGDQPLSFDAFLLMTDPYATWRSVKIRYVNEGFPGLELFPGKRPTDRLDTLNSLIVVWMCAYEKARKGMPLQNSARVTLHYRGVADETGIVSELSRVLEKTTIEAADCDELIYYENGVDVREWFERRLMERAPKHLAFRAEFSRFPKKEPP